MFTLRLIRREYTQFTGSYSVSGGSISGNPGEAIWNADISSPGYGGTLAADLLPSPATGSSTFTPRNVSLTANVIYDWHTVPVTLTDPGTSTATIAETFNLAAPQGSQGATVPEPASLDRLVAAGLHRYRLPLVAEQESRLSRFQIVIEQDPCRILWGFSFAVAMHLQPPVRDFWKDRVEKANAE